MAKEIQELIDVMKNRRNSHAKKKRESMDGYQDQYCHGRIDECDFVIRKLNILKNIINSPQTKQHETGNG